MIYVRRIWVVRLDQVYHSSLTALITLDACQENNFLLVLLLFPSSAICDGPAPTWLPHIFMSFLCAFPSFFRRNFLTCQFPYHLIKCSNSFIRTMSSNSGFQRIKVVHNKNYKPSGPKSYVYLLHKYKFKPSKDGPYFVANHAHQQGKHGPSRCIFASNLTGFVGTYSIQRPLSRLWKLYCAAVHFVATI